MSDSDVPGLPRHYQPAPRAFEGRTILVTGAGGGLGSALCTALGSAGATVILLGRQIPMLEASYDRIVAAGGPEPAIVPINLLTAKWGDFETAVQAISENFGRLDGLVHGAAHFRSFMRLEDLEPREWLDAMQVNLTAPYVLTRLCLPLLRRSNDASIVFIADRGAREAMPYHGAYGVSKAAADALMAQWAAELSKEAESGSGLRFNSLHPGPMRTPLRTRGFVPEQAEKAPLPEAAVAPLLWLLGPDSRGVSGQRFSLDQALG